MFCDHAYAVTSSAFLAAPYGPKVADHRQREGRAICSRAVAAGIHRRRPGGVSMPVGAPAFLLGPQCKAGRPLAGVATRGPPERVRSSLGVTAAVRLLHSRPITPAGSGPERRLNRAKNKMLASSALVAVRPTLWINTALEPLPATLPPDGVGGKMARGHGPCRRRSRPNRKWVSLPRRRSSKGN